MNNHIQELAEQARSEVRDEWAKGNKIPYPEAHYAFQRDNDQKFAELIVAECLNKIYLEAAQYAEPVWAFELINDIKEHFGVAE